MLLNQTNIKKKKKFIYCTIEKMPTLQMMEPQKSNTTMFPSTKQQITAPTEKGKQTRRMIYEVINNKKTKKQNYFEEKYTNEPCTHHFHLKDKVKVTQNLGPLAHAPIKY
jgi:hypothetical protein